MATNKNNISISISPEAKECLDQINTWSGMDRKLIMDRLLKWYGRVPEELQAAIMMNVPDSIRQDYVRLMLERLEAQEDPASRPAGQIAPDVAGRPKRSFAAKKAAGFKGTPKRD
ncbi:MAG: hypothetical protein JKX85_06205 [Phycisphaeraceae bacterium]|nr:hypothetical protein [Phycisphaeraceae bacterium]